MEEKQITIDGLEVHYTTAGDGQPLLILHGWGGNAASWEKVQPLLAQKKYKVIAVDLPGFGKTAPPPTGWSLEKYVDFTHSFIHELGHDRFAVLGHSFGGRVAIRYAVKHPADLTKVILCAAAGIRHMRIRYRVLLVVAKVANFIGSLPILRRWKDDVRRLFYRAIGRRDYMEVEGVMKEIFLSVLSKNLKPLLSSISHPTLILWGEKDSYVPVQDAHTMNKEIPDAELVIFPGIGHGPHKEIPEQVAKEVDRFLKAQ